MGSDCWGGASGGPPLGRSNSIAYVTFGPRRRGLSQLARTRMRWPCRAPSLWLHGECWPRHPGVSLLPTPNIVMRKFIARL